MAKSAIDVSFEIAKEPNEKENVEGKTSIEESEVAESGESEAENESEVEGEAESEVEGEGKEPEENSENSESEKQNSAPPWVKDVRRRNKTLARENAELKRKLLEANPQREIVRPNMADFQDEESYADALIEWKQSVRSSEEAVFAKESEWQNQVSDYLNAKKQLDGDQYSEDELFVESALSEDQQRALVAGFGSEATKLVIGLANSPELLSDLSKISNTAKFSVELAKLHANMKVKNRKPKTAPETRVKGEQSGGTVSKSLDQMLEKSDDLTDYLRARKKKRRQ